MNTIYPPHIPETRNCRQCGQPFSMPDDFADMASLARVWTKHVFVCPSCSEAEVQKETQRCLQIATNTVAARAERWKKICPKEFQNHDPHKYPNREALKRVMEWRFGSDGLMLHGLTRAGKSRAAWLLLEREFMEKRSVKCLDSVSGLDYARRYHESPGDCHQWLEKMCSVDMLLLDDVFKSKLTDSFEQAIFSIIRVRTEAAKPIIVTTNDTDDTLVSRMSADRGPAIVSRLREYCKAINFSRV